MARNCAPPAHIRVYARSLVGAGGYGLITSWPRITDPALESVVARGPRAIIEL
jgi:hypothetical protein